MVRPLDLRLLFSDRTDCGYKAMLLPAIVPSYRSSRTCVPITNDITKPRPPSRFLTPPSRPSQQWALPDGLAEKSSTHSCTQTHSVLYKFCRPFPPPPPPVFLFFSGCVHAAAAVTNTADMAAACEHLSSLCMLMLRTLSNLLPRLAYHTAPRLVCPFRVSSDTHALHASVDTSERQRNDLLVGNCFKFVGLRRGQARPKAKGQAGPKGRRSGQP